MPPTPEHKSHTGVKIFNLDFMGFSNILGWAWPEWVGSMKLGFSDGLGQVLTTRALKHVPPTPEHKSHTGVKSHTNRIHKSRKRALEICNPNGTEGQ